MACLAVNSRSHLAEQIEEHPYLRLPPQARADATAARMDFRSLMFQWMDLENRLAIPLEDARGNIVLAGDRHLDDMKTARYDTRRRARQFDGVAFMEALTAAESSFDAASGVPFLAYFTQAYSQRVYEQAGELIESHDCSNGLHLSEEKAGLLRELNRLMESMNLQPEQLNDELLSTLAEVMRVPAARLKKLLVESYLIRNPQSLDAPISEDENEMILAQQIADGRESAAANLEWIDLFAFTVDVFCRKTQKKYPRLFMSNGIVLLVRDERHADEAAAYAKVLEKKERILWERLFFADYLAFLYVTPPVPESVRQLILGRLEREPINRTIAAFLHVTEGNVSQHYKQYRIQLQAIREIYEP